MEPLYYIARGLGATSRGVGILKALNTGTMITAWKTVCDLENIKFFGGLPRHGGVFIWDGVPQRPNILGVHLSLGDLGLDVDQVIDVQVPILVRAPTGDDLSNAEEWWCNPPARMVTVEGQRIAEIPEPTQPRILACRGGNLPAWQRFKREITKERPEARLVIPGRYFYWPAVALMETADEVIGGGQSTRECRALQDKVYDGAAHVAGEIRAYLERRGITI